MANVDAIAAEASAQYGAADDRGPASPPVALPTLRGNEPNWVNQPADKAQSPIVQAGNLKESNGTIQPWDGSSALTLANPDGSDIRSLYFPNLPNPVTVYVGSASANGPGVWTTSESSEVVLLPSAIDTVTITASAPFGKTVQVFATNDVLSPIAPYVTIVGDIATVSTNPYPQGATPFNARILSGAFDGTNQGLDFSTPPPNLPLSLNVNQQIYISYLQIQGLDQQLQAWSLEVDARAGGAFTGTSEVVGLRDGTFSFNPAIPAFACIAAGEAYLKLQLQYYTSVVGLLNVRAVVAGYIL